MGCAASAEGQVSSVAAPDNGSPRGPSVGALPSAIQQHQHKGVGAKSFLAQKAESKTFFVLRKTEPVADHYRIEKELGKGQVRTYHVHLHFGLPCNSSARIIRSNLKLPHLPLQFGVVSLAVRKTDKKTFAMKSISKR